MVHARAVFALIGCFVATALAGSAHAITVLDYDSAFFGDFQTSPYTEDGTTTTVNSGHYDIVDDPLGDLGDQMFQIDELGESGTELTEVVITFDGGLLFDAISLDIVNPADTAGEYTISAIGGSGSISGPTTGGIFNFGAGFEGITGLRFTQNSAGFFAWDDLTLEVVPEPASASLLGLGLLGLARRRRRD